MEERQHAQRLGDRCAPVSLSKSLDLEELVRHTTVHMEELKWEKELGPAGPWGLNS